MIPALLRSTLCALALSLGTACKGQPPQSPAIPPRPEAASSPSVQPSPSGSPSEDVTPAIAPAPNRSPTPSAGDDRRKIVLASYNVRNYLRMSRYVNGVDTPDQPKPESEIAAVVGNIVKLQPDILAVQEMGPRDQFGDFVARLKAAGLNFEHTKLLDAHDQARHLGLLSKFPIVADNSVADAFYELNGVQEPVQRGFLDVTLEIQPGYRLRCITAHLKSKRPVPQGEAMMRRFEGRLLRQHIDKILADQPDTRLYVCGDLNDTKNEDVIKDIIGVKGSHTYMGDLWLKDSRGERWTHFYATGDSYARIDYFLISPALWRDVDKKAGGIFDEPTWSDASDHRPIWAVLRIPAAH